MSNINHQKIFSSKTVDRIRLDLQGGKSLNTYFENDYRVDESMVLDSTICVTGLKPELLVDEGDRSATDLANAIAIHQYYADMDETQATDSRLWAYLSHVEFRDYSLRRWGLNTTPYALERDGNERVAKINQLIEHWFVGANRDLRRHSIARLWWPAHLTCSPWESDPDFFEDLRKDDPYYYTRILMSSQDIYAVLLERSMGRSSRILVSILEYLDLNREFMKSRSSIRNLIIELNLVFGTKKIDTLSRQNLKLLISSVASGIGESK